MKTKEREMVSYWKTQDSVEAKVYKASDGHYEMQMKGEKYPFPGHPRGVVLMSQKPGEFSTFSRLKHDIKNKIFNETWKMLEEGKDDDEILFYLRKIGIPEVLSFADELKYDLLPYERMVPPVKELYRAMTAVENGSENWRKLKELGCFIMQEDDAYRMRLQWIVKFFPKWYKPKLEHFNTGLGMLEHAEPIGDMKAKQRLFRRVLLFMLRDPAMKTRFDALMKEVDWNKVKLTDADKYFFRAKYFKVDYPQDEY